MAEGLITISAVDDSVPGQSLVTLGSSETSETCTIPMPDDALKDMLAIADHPDGEPEGMDVAAAYERLEPLLDGCPANLRPIP
jgi:hypothetical protein